MSEQVASQSEGVPSKEGLSPEEYNDVMRMFGIEQEPASAESTDEGAEDVLDENQGEPATAEPKKIKVKYNKEEIEIDEDKIPEYVQKGLALEKERERKAEYEKALQRAAKLAGFTSHEEYLKSLDKLEQEAQKQQEEQLDKLKKQLLEDAENAGLDVDKLELYIDNHPLLRQAREAISEREKLQQEAKITQERQALQSQWEELFAKYPELGKGDEASWLTPEMESRIKRGYHPLDAYELAHKDTLLQEERKRMEQALIKQNRINKRAQVEGNTTSEPEDEVPEAVKGAFAMFGLDPKTAKKFM